MFPWSLRFYNFLTVDASKAMPVAQLYAYANVLITVISEEYNNKTGSDFFVKQQAFTKYNFVSEKGIHASSVCHPMPFSADAFVM